MGATKCTPGQLLWPGLAARLLVDAGDALEPASQRCAATRGGAAARLWRTAGVVAVAAGNAEILSYGPRNLKRLAALSGVPILAANLLLESGAQVPGTQPWSLVKHGGRRVAFIGLTAPRTAVYKGLGLHVQEPVAVAASLARHLRRKADLVVALSHLGLWDDEELSKVPGVDLIVGGHSHDRLDEPYSPGESPVVQAARGGRWIGEVKVYGNGRPSGGLRAAPNIEEHPGVLRELTRIDLDVEAWSRRFVAMLSEPLTRDQFGRKIANISRKMIGADGALLLKGSVVAGLPQGLVNRGTLHRAYPFAFKPSIADIDGDLLLEILERGYNPSQCRRKLPVFRGQRSGGLYAARIEVHLDPKGRHSRVRRALVNGQPLRLRNSYRLATSDLETIPLAGLVNEPIPAVIRSDMLIADLIEEDLMRGDVDKRAHYKC